MCPEGLKMLVITYSLYFCILSPLMIWAFTNQVAFYDRCVCVDLRNLTQANFESCQALYKNFQWISILAEVAIVFGACFFSLHAYAMLCHKRTQVQSVHDEFSLQ